MVVGPQSLSLYQLVAHHGHFSLHACMPTSNLTEGLHEESGSLEEGSRSWNSVSGIVYDTAQHNKTCQ